ncbi:sensor histidine kinase [Nocardia farcinica]|uniref:sensor histidine kinase n=1 Tax=Nocardia farcinica TaxID=37329 RepID=UPI001895CAD8|nr:histidine kinase [Nocardia farcinica]MBF6141477.1 sensor histidine kinase [Nocardia farcinica]MBF6383225.1 sensor histidine kinase [Nocardia farcinica]MBF6536091.1 sensor histidine kinase [Nocardia farcinica]
MEQDTGQAVARRGLRARLRAQAATMSGTAWFDLATVFVVLVLYTVAWPTLHLTHVVAPGAQPFVAALAAFPLLLVRINPALGWAVSAGSALVIALAIPHQPANEMPFQVVHVLSLIVLLFAVGLRAPMQLVLLAWASTSLLFGTTMPGEGEAFANAAWGWPIALTVVVLFAMLIRWLVLSRRQLVRQEEENELERARRAILEEKARIARDLHDVVAHHMSLVVVQAQTAPYRVAGVNEAARAEFESISTTAREALNEIRGMLGVLRSDGVAPEHSPQPKAGEVLALFEGARRAGVDIDWTVEGDLSRVADTTGLALYRIVQESLSNASRHAPGAAVRVTLRCADTLDLLVVNGPAAAPAGSAGNGGHGIAGMRARALAAGGELVAESTADGGFEVRARMPLTPDPVVTVAAPAAPTAPTASVAPTAPAASVAPDSAVVAQPAPVDASGRGA